MNPENAVYVVSYIDRVHDCIRREGFRTEKEARRYAAKIERRRCCYSDTIVIKAREVRGEWAAAVFATGAL